MLDEYFMDGSYGNSTLPKVFVLLPREVKSVHKFVLYRAFKMEDFGNVIQRFCI